MEEDILKFSPTAMFDLIYFILSYENQVLHRAHTPSVYPRLVVNYELAIFP